MAQGKCEYCGTEFDPTQGICPLCGIPEDVIQQTIRRAPKKEEPAYNREKNHSRSRSRGGRHRTTKKEHIPKWLSILICLILTLTVLVGVIFAMYSMGAFDLKPKEIPDDALTLPYDDQEDKEEVPDVPDVPEVESILCTGIALSFPEVSLFEEGETVALSVNFQPENTTEEIIWTVEDNEIASVDQSGVVTARSHGTTTVAVTCGAQTASCEIINDFGAILEDDEVPDETTNNASFNLIDFTLREKDETATITVNNAPEGVEIVWSVANSAVATINDGVVKAVSKGTTKVTANVGGKELTCIVRCNLAGDVAPSNENAEVVQSAELSHTDVTIAVGETFVLSASGGTATPIFASNNGAVCSVSEAGTVTGIAGGSTKITVKLGDKTLTCVVYVK